MHRIPKSVFKVNVFQIRQRLKRDYTDGKYDSIEQYERKVNNEYKYRGVFLQKSKEGHRYKFKSLTLIKHRGIKWTYTL